MRIPEWAILFYPLLMMAGLWTAIWLKGRQPPDPRLTPYQRLWIGLLAFTGAMLTAKLPFLLFSSTWTDATSLFLTGKTVLFGLVGGYLGVEIAKWRLGIHFKTGDAFAVPAAGAIGVGRLSCLAGSCCYGTPTSLPWAVVFPRIDLLPRHPTQLYEFLFHISAAIILDSLRRKGRFRNQLIKLYFIAYCIYRFFTEWIRPEARLAGGLTAYQWTCLGLIGVFAVLWYRDARAMQAASEL